MVLDVVVVVGVEAEGMAEAGVVVCWKPVAFAA